jgi:hypothetical protein
MSSIYYLNLSLGLINKSRFTADMGKTWHSNAWYTPKRDGSLEDYLGIHDGLSSFPLFKGYEHFRMLKDRGFFLPCYSVIRVMYNIGRGDEHYLVTDDFQLEGVEVNVHAGKAGTHDPKKLLSGRCPPWEAQNLDHNLMYKIRAQKNKMRLPGFEPGSNAP